ncbi:MAG: hypothetical protein ACI4Q4_07700 [Oscillospiraceae bacterium]
MVEATSMPIIQKAVKAIYDMSEDTKIRELLGVIIQPNIMQNGELLHSLLLAYNR